MWFRPSTPFATARRYAGPEQMLELVNSVTNRGRNIFVDGNRLAEALVRQPHGRELFLMGVAYQGGLIPISLEAMEKAIELNGVDIERNLQAFSWGRKYYEDAAWVEELPRFRNANVRPSLDRPRRRAARISERGVRAIVRRISWRRSPSRRCERWSRSTCTS